MTASESEEPEPRGVVEERGKDAEASLHSQRFIRWQTIQAIATSIAAGAASFAVVFGVPQYLQVREDRRVEKTLDYVQRFSSDERIGQAHRALSAVLWENSDEADELEHASPEERLQYWRILIEVKGLEAHIAEVVDFFESLEVCISSKICAREEAVMFFGDYAWRFQRNFGGHLAGRRERSPGYARGLGVLAKDHPKPPI